MPTLYRGSVKDVLGPLEGGAVAFDYTDAYSVFDWGRMPDALARKGEALATLAADWFERLERPETWRELSKTAEALELRKGNRFGAAFNELGERLKAEGLRTHYRGLGDGARPVAQASRPERRLIVRQVSVVKPLPAAVLGRASHDYGPTRAAPAPRLVPLEVVFRFAVPAGSSLIDRLREEPGYLAERGFADARAEAGARWSFPVLELFTKLEPSDRPVGYGEALAISGLSGAQLQEVLFRTAWVAGFLRAACARAGLELADGKLEWALEADGSLVLVDAIGPDELRILKDGVQLSKEFLRTFYRGTPWYQAVTKAKKQAGAEGVAEWKKFVAAGPPALPPALRDAGAHLYMMLTNRLTGRAWFPEAWPLEKVVEAIREAGA